MHFAIISRRQVVVVLVVLEEEEEDEECWVVSLVRIFFKFFLFVCLF